MILAISIYYSVCFLFLLFALCHFLLSYIFDSLQSIELFRKGVDY